MKTASLILTLLFSATAWADPAASDAPKLMIPGAPAPAGRPAPTSLSLKFVKVPLGNVTRVLSARYNVQVSIAANARAPITGDFSKLDVRAALGEAARQAGLVVTALAPDAGGGFSLALPEAKKAKAATAAPVATEPAPEAQAKLEAAARQRAELLRQRASLMEQSSHSDPQS